MFNSIFRKQVIIYIGTLIISFVVLGVGLSLAFENYFVNQKEKMLIEQGKKLSSYIQSYKYSLFGAFSKNQIESEVQILNKYLDASFFYVEKVGDEAIITISSPELYGVKLSLDEVKDVFEGKRTTTQGKIGKIFTYNVLTVRYPVFIENEVVGAIFMNSSMAELNRTNAEVFRITITCLLYSAAVAFVLIYISSKNISRPLYQMNEAAKVIASGDFEKRIVVKSKDEVSQLATSFNNMAESLYQQEKQRNEFIANISHDLRSPLTSMRGFLQAIQDGTVPEEKKSYYLDIVLDETERLSKLANDLLDLNKIQTMDIELNKSDFDINELIRNIVLKFEARILQKSITINISFADERNIVNADYEKIQRVIYNLLDNAVKFTDYNGEIFVETTIVDKKVFVSIKDNGRGVSLDDQKRIFDRFYKADTSRGEDKMGSGLGLSIVKAFVKAHDENIHIESETGKGCEFSFGLSIVDEDK